MAASFGNGVRHKVTIEYCVPCDYSRQALLATEALVWDYQHEIEKLDLVMGTMGVFEVTVDGEVLFSKKTEERFPDEGELAKRFLALLDPTAKKYPRS